MNVTVYRVEMTSYGIGPYSWDRLPSPLRETVQVATDRMLEAHASNVPVTGRPTPYHDVPEWEARGWDGDWRCACISREALDWWFEGWMELLLMLGFKVVAYSVPEDEVLWGSKQVAFNYNKATRLGVEESIEELEAVK